ncbi:MAG: hypothetical protein KatS3mg023_3877 [Armatimonadota bacterium]|nr:MAG: hypothetical protein KatS3mg023_3877 [Armatimonadota bacterium]
MDKVTKDILEEIDPQWIQRVMEDPLLFAETFLVDPEHRKPFKANYVQRLIFDAVKHHRRIVVRVARRSGKTYALSVLALWSAFVRPSNRILVICPDSAKVEAIFNNIDAFLESNSFLRASLSGSRRAPYMTREFSNGSRISGFSAGSRSKGEAQTLRGQGADVVIIDEAAYFNDEDFTAINPIIEGDIHHEPPITIMSSTPRMNSGRFYDTCTNPELKKIWYEIHVPASKNPDYTSRIDYIRASVGKLEWETEYEAEFPEQGEGFFRKGDILYAKREYHYNINNVPKDGYLAFGVDWDKVSAGCTIAVVHYEPEIRLYKLVYREEVERSDFTLTEAVSRIIALNEQLKPHWIYVDRGLGEQQVELLHLHGKQYPHTKLHEKVKGWWFHQYVEREDPVTGERVKVRLKDAMNTYLANLLEQRRFVFSVWDNKFDMQLRSYRVVGVSSSGLRYSSDQEHIIDSTALAIWALKTNYEDRQVGLVYEAERMRAAMVQLESDRPTSLIRSFYNSVTSGYTETPRGGFRSFTDFGGSRSF